MFFIILAVVVLILSFTELLIFNEEVLLALCFIAFIFFAYSSLSDGFSSDFEAQTLKLINELLAASNQKITLAFVDFQDAKLSLTSTQEASLLSQIVSFYLLKDSKLASNQTLTSAYSVISSKLLEVKKLSESIKKNTRKSIVQLIVAYHGNIKVTSGSGKH
jgi:hypothetical protein